MYRTVMYLVGCIAVIALVGLCTPPNGPYGFFLPNGIAAWALLAMALILPLIIILQHYKKQLFLGIFLQLVGCGLLAVATIGLVGSPTYFGMLSSYPAVANLFLMFLVGLTYLISGLEVPSVPLRLTRPVVLLWQRMHPGYYAHASRAKAIAATHAAVAWYYAHRDASVPTFQG